jgi:hypothetical protein
VNPINYLEKKISFVENVDEIVRLSKEEFRLSLETSIISNLSNMSLVRPKPWAPLHDVHENIY